MNHELAGRHHRQQDDECQRSAPPAESVRVAGCGRHGDRRATSDAAQIDESRPGEEQSPQPLPEIGLPGDALLEVEASAADEVIADVSGAVVRRTHVHPSSPFDALERQEHLGFAGRQRQLFDRVAIAVATAEVHLTVDAGRITLQHLLYKADALEELAPVERADQAQTGDQVGDAGLLGRLVLSVVPDRILHRLAAARQCLVQLAVQAGRDRAERAGAPQEVCDEGGVHFGRPLAKAVPRGFDRRGQAVCRHAMHARLGQHVAAFAEVVDQRELQHARPRPQLANGQRRDRLEGTDEALEPLCVDPAGACPDQFDGERVDARQTGELIGRHAGQSPEERRRQIVLNVACRGRDDVEVVEQPFGSRGDGLVLGVLRQLGVDVPQRLHVRPQLPEVRASVAEPVRGDRDQCREAACMFLEQLDAEQLDVSARHSRNRRFLPHR